MCAEKNEKKPLAERILAEERVEKSPHNYRMQTISHKRLPICNLWSDND